MDSVHILTREGREAVASLETGKHGGPVLVIRDSATGTVLLGCKTVDASNEVLSTILDPGTVETVHSLLWSLVLDTMGGE